ncbi:MAG: NAD-glutamate dehydrogenase, partial [Propionibacteriales bacterium]|nr:NAD-glutamate dehydrogenase [Propionibacteriales bacterium]
LSVHTRLVAAFDHRHIFLDPAPDVATSYRERRRLFELPRSSWADYDQSLISEGGGVHPRTLKSVPISPQVADALGLDEGVVALTPSDLMRAILVAPVDLLWNGGIGTYVKSAAEVNAEVGDKANDAIRVDGADLRCRAVGEGGNLGCTQRGRIEYAQAGGRINTDAIDNSAGVDTSDHEVNIKIMLDRVTDAGDLTRKQRNALLASMTDEVAELVLADNYGQNLALANSVAVARSLLHVHEAWMRRLEKRSLLDRGIEFLPSGKEIENRRAAGAALTAPELSVLLAYTKIVLAAELVTGDLPDDPFLRGELAGYFPRTLQRDYQDQMDAHPLRREIIVTQIVNSMVNFAGITFFHRLSQETSASAEELTRAHLVCRAIYGARELQDRINGLDSMVPAAVQTDMRLSLRTLTERATRWMVNHRRPPLESEAAVEYFGPELSRVVKELPGLLRGIQADEFTQRHGQLVSSGVPDDIATAVAVLPHAYAALEIVEIARKDGVDPIEVADVHETLAEQLCLSQLLAKIFDLPRNDRWQTMARASLRDDLHGVHAALTSEVLAGTDAHLSADERVAAWEAREDVVALRARSTLDDILTDDDADLARLSVALRVVRTMVAAA